MARAKHGQRLAAFLRLYREHGDGWTAAQYAAALGDGVVREYVVATASRKGLELRKEAVQGGPRAINPALLIWTVEKVDEAVRSLPVRVSAAGGAVVTKEALRLTIVASASRLFRDVPWTMLRAVDMEVAQEIVSAEIEKLRQEHEGRN